MHKNNKNINPSNAKDFKKSLLRLFKDLNEYKKIVIFFLTIIFKLVYNVGVVNTYGVLFFF